MVEAVIAPAAHSRKLRIDKLPAFAPRNDRSSPIETQSASCASSARAKARGPSDGVPR
jgi:hypothetical protein